MMSAVIREENTGQAEVRDTFVVPKIGTVAGCLVTDGKVIRGGHARIIRDGVVTYTGKISSLKDLKMMLKKLLMVMSVVLCLINSMILKLETLSKHLFKLKRKFQ